MAGKNANAPVGAAPVQEQQPEFVKSFSDDVLKAVEEANDGLKGDSFTDVAEAIKAAGNDDEFFNPTLSQFREGMYINTDSSIAKIKKTQVGRGSRKAWCISCPVGYKDPVSGEVVYSGAFRFFPSSLRKTIQVTDELGEPVLDENMAPIVRENRGNAVYEAAKACGNPAQLLSYAMDKVFHITNITRDFGPSVFVAQKDGSNKATGHKLTSMPTFELVTQ
jgi:hypothetical protein